MSTTKAAKKALRLQMKQDLVALDAEPISQQARKAQEAVTRLAQYKTAKRLSVYLSMPTGEAGTDIIVKDALRAGKSVFVPYIYKQSGSMTKVMDMLQLASLDEYEGLSRDSWGIPTLPRADIESRRNATGGKGLPLAGGEMGSEALDMIIVPAVAFDRQMRRLGHGAGYYDTFLSRYYADPTSKRPSLVGLCLAEQVLSDPIPVTDQDWNVDMVVTGRGDVLTRP